MYSEGCDEYLDDGVDRQIPGHQIDFHMSGLHYHVFDPKNQYFKLITEIINKKILIMYTNYIS